MPISKVERIGSGCLLGCMGVLIFGAGSSLLYVAFFVAKPQERFMLLFFTATITIMPATIALGAVMLRNQSGKSKQFLGAVAEKLQGQLNLPGFLTLLAVPRVEANRNSVFVEIRLLRQRHRAGSMVFASMIERPDAKLGARFLVPSHRIYIRIQKPNAVRFVVLTRIRLGAAGATGAGLQELTSGDAVIDESTVAVTDRSDLLASAWRDATFRDVCLSLIHVNTPYFARAEMGPRGIEWIGIASDNVTPETVAWITDTLLWWAQEVDSRTHGGMS